MRLGARCGAGANLGRTLQETGPEGHPAPGATVGFIMACGNEAWRAQFFLHTIPKASSW